MSDITITRDSCACCRRGRTSERSDRSKETTMDITDRKLLDVDENRNESAWTGFLVGPLNGLLDSSRLAMLF
jgi:hypothetical protein